MPGPGSAKVNTSPSSLPQSIISDLAAGYLANHTKLILVPLKPGDYEGFPLSHLKVCAGRNKSPVCFYAVITVSQACNPQRSDNDIAPAFITWRRGERENADFEQMNTLTFMQ
uniref:Uncharacterized protein n=1 Tax=Anabas testudineus TaxID=64144 RepID=A0A7N6AGY8_ANATE